MHSVCGAGGFIGGHLVRELISRGHEVRAVDVKPLDEWWQHTGAETRQLDLRDARACREACVGADWVFNLAADMGGMGYLDAERVATLHTVEITSCMIRAAHEAGVARYFQASSACVYPDYLQQTEEVSLKESDAWPADPEPAYGLEKLVGEEFCKWYRIQRGLETRVARYHNVYGRNGSWTGGREKSPAAICRKVAEAVLSGDHKIEIWGDGEQTRSFMYVDDCVEGTLRIMDSDIVDPINLGSSELVSINQLVSMVEVIAGVSLERCYLPDAPQGVRGRNSDNTRIKAELGWEPCTSLAYGLERLYGWVYDEIQRSNQG